MRSHDDSPDWCALDFRFHILGSSSSGNCAFLATPYARVLIDAGFSAKRIDTALRAIGESIDRIDAVFVTHEHADHAVGLPALAKKPGMRLYANAATAREIRPKLTCDANWHLFENGADLVFRDIRVHPFAIPHDAADPVAYKFVAHEGTLFEKRLAWITDLGHVPETVRRHASDVDILVLESNYDPDLLERSDRSFPLKQRIRGRHGHLANLDALALITALDNPRLSEVHLAHLSRECNSPDVVRRLFADLVAARPACRFHIVEPLA